MQLAPRTTPDKGNIRFVTHEEYRLMELQFEKMKSEMDSFNQLRNQIPVQQFIYNGIACFLIIISLA
jgi:hypothetical protein